MLRPLRPWLGSMAALVAACGGTPKAVEPSSDATTLPPIATAPPPPVVPSSTTPGAAASPKENMSAQLGGMRLGMTVEQFVGACRGARGTALKVEEIDLLCSVAPMPLKFSGRAGVDLDGQVVGKFCGPDGTVCELAYLVRGDAQHRDDQAGAMMEMLAGKYGPPSSREGHEGNDLRARCQRDRSVHFKRGWHFGPKQTPPHPVGWVRLVYDCDLRGADAEDSLALFYDDIHGLRFRSAEYDERRENF